MKIHLLPWIRLRIYLRCMGMMVGFGSLWIENGFSQHVAVSAGIIDSLVSDYRVLAQSLSNSQRLDRLREGEVLIRQLPSTDHLSMARYYALYIPVFRFNYQLDSVARYLDLMGTHLDALPQPAAEKITWWYEKARFAFQESDYATGMNFSQQGLQYLRAYFPDLLREKYLLLNTIGIANRRLGKVDEAIDHYERILRTSWDEANAVKMNGAILNNLGLAYKDCGDWTLAIARLQSAIQYYSKNISPTFEDIGSGFDNLAICYEAIGQPDSALYYSHRSLQFIHLNLGALHPDQLLPMNSITYTLIKQGRLDEALSMNEQSLALLRQLGWSENSPEGDYYLADGFDVLAYSILIHRFRYQHAHDTLELLDAIQAGDDFMAMTDYAYDNLKNDLSKELFLNKHNDIFTACIASLADLYAFHPDTSLFAKAFGYAEKFKSLELLYAAQKDQADQVPRFRPYNDQYHGFQDSIRHYEDKLFDSSIDAAVHALSQNRLNSFKVSFAIWKENIRKNQPDYYQLIYHPEPVTIAQLKASLRNDQCILSYHVGLDEIFAFVITDHHLFFLHKEIRTNLNQTITQFRKAIEGYFLQPKATDSTYLDAADDYIHIASDLYGLLLKPIDSLLTDRVIIVLDKSLSYLPFDLLLAAMPEESFRFRDHHYTLLDHAVSYSYSAKLWWDMQSRPALKAMSMLAVAPDFQAPVSSGAQSSTNFPPLLYNETEVKQLNLLIKGKLLLNHEATRENFIHNCSKHAVLHLATHSKANDEEGDFSYLAFSPEKDGINKLYAGDIYNLDLHAELVTLSACETGLGELRSGEGMISLARAFTFAGARSILSSLWSVNDKSTSTLMTLFYQNLQSGLPKDVALQKAKLTFLKSKGHADDHPFYWGGFVPIGDMRPMEFHQKSYWVSILLILLIISTGFFIFFRKKLNLLGTTL